ncbi:hypothetical protein M9Y10_008161 [Tritrichomonas musculus]|uniref:Uncharacterized protein n=1 Tax=Tritrichomonas musculus TaxID=1915356 RepID=A0ABR2IXG6_9EUKA
MNMVEEPQGSPLILQTDLECSDQEMPKIRRKSSMNESTDIIPPIQKGKKTFHHFILYILFAFSGITTISLAFMFKSYLNRTVLFILYEIGSFLSTPILLLFFEAYHYILPPMYNLFDDSQEKTELADIGA